MRAERLTLARKKGAQAIVDTLTLERGLGVRGDYRSAKDGSVSLLSGEGRASRPFCRRPLHGFLLGKRAHRRAGLRGAARRHAAFYRAVFRRDRPRRQALLCGVQPRQKPGRLSAAEKLRLCKGRRRRRRPHERSHRDRNEMNDQYGRKIEYLRLSLTERCTLRCSYCRASEGLCPKQSELTADEFLRIVRIMASVGIKKVRLTGGEPMLRRDLLEIVSGIRAIDGIQEITMTTNASTSPGRRAR
jgi:hypothetical protein